MMPLHCATTDWPPIAGMNEGQAKDTIWKLVLEGIDDIIADPTSLDLADCEKEDLHKSAADCFQIAFNDWKVYAREMR